jgi:hypothetical protein
MNGAGAKIDFEYSKMSFCDVGKAHRGHSDSNMGREALTGFVQGKEGHSPNLAYKRRSKQMCSFSQLTSLAYHRPEYNLVRQGQGKYYLST